MKKKTKTTLIVIGTVLAVLLIAAGIAYGVITANYNRARAEAEAQRLLVDQLAVEDRVFPIAEAYGITDLKTESMNGEYNSANFIFSSEQFGTLSDFDKLMMLTDIDAEFYRDDNIFPANSPMAGYTFFFRLNCNGVSYRSTVDNGLSYLQEDLSINRDVCAITDYAQAVTAHLDQLMRTEVYSNGKTRVSPRKTGETCPVCNGTGYVKYYSSGSALESFFSGVPAYTTGPCSSCDGTGKR